MKPAHLVVGGALLLAAAVALRLLWTPAPPRTEDERPAEAESAEAPPEASPRPGEGPAQNVAPPPPAAKAPRRGRSDADLKAAQRRFMKTYGAAAQANDFTTAAPPGHDAAAMRKISGQFATWAASAENERAQVRFLGVDCQSPPCVMALEFNPDRDSSFFDRADRFLRGKASGTAHAFPHVVDVDKTRVWYFYSPHAKGSAEHFQYVKPALERVREQAAALPSYNPSRDGPAGEGEILPQPRTP